MDFLDLPVSCTCLGTFSTIISSNKFSTTSSIYSFSGIPVMQILVASILFHKSLQFSSVQFSRSVVSDSL